MPIPIAYLSVIIIWSTTPLAIKWSTGGVSFLFGVTSRMTIGLVVALLLCGLSGSGLPLHRRACLTYTAAGMGVFGAMLGAYWGSQYIPSGWISVIFGTSPIMTSILASLYLGERSVGIRQTGALVLSLLGLAVMFQHSYSMGARVMDGIAAVMLGVVFYSISLVAVKLIDAKIKPASSMTGTLIITVVLYSLTWMISGEELPASIPLKTAGSILYLSIVGSVLAFMLFFHILQHVSATKAAMITLITPCCALLLGNLLNHESVNPEIILGTAMVLVGLLIFEFGDAIPRLRSILSARKLLKMNQNSIMRGPTPVKDTPGLTCKPIVTDMDSS